jgi:hypothetical protein
MRVLVLARQGAAPGGRGFLATLLLEDNEDIVEVGEWEDPVPVALLAAKQGSSEDGDGGEKDLLDGLDEDMVQLGRAGAKILRASTDWIEHNDAHGLEKFEPLRNVEVVELPGYDALTDVSFSSRLIDFFQILMDHTGRHSCNENQEYCTCAIPCRLRCASS